MTDKTIDVIAALPEAELDKAAEEAVVARVKDIVARGNVAVFTRPHRIFPDITVVKKVTRVRANQYGDLESDNGHVAVWDAAYVLTEEKP